MSDSTWAWEMRLQPCLVKTTDITAGMQPLLMKKWVAPGGVCTAVGACGWGRREEGGVHGEGCRGAAEQQIHAQEHGSGLGPHKRVAPSLRAICHLPHHNNINNNSYTQGASDDVWGGSN